MSYKALAALMLLGGCTAAPATPELAAACVMHPVAILQTLSAHSVPVVVVGINGQPAAMVVDTGATDSVLTDEFVHRTGLSRHASLRSFVGVGGEVGKGDVTVPSFELGYATARNVTFGDVGELRFGQPNGAPVDGLLGGDILSNYDVLLDLGRQRVEIYDAEHCETGFEPFGGRGFSGQLHLSATQPVIAGALDGMRLPFLLDSGSMNSYVTKRTVRHLGVDVSHDKAIPTIGIGEADVLTPVHRFGTLSIGPEQIQDPLIAVFSGPINVLGDDVLENNRLLLAYQARRIYIEPSAAFIVTPAGGLGSTVVAPAASPAAKAGSGRG